MKQIKQPGKRRARSLRGKSLTHRGGNYQVTYQGRRMPVYTIYRHTTRLWWKVTSIIYKGCRKLMPYWRFPHYGLRRLITITRSLPDRAPTRDPGLGESIREVLLR